MLIYYMAIAWPGLSLPGGHLVDGLKGDKEGPEMALGKGLNLLPYAGSEGPSQESPVGGTPRAIARDEELF